jgi:anti-sigma factor RsiW
VTCDGNGNGNVAPPRAQLTCREVVELVTAYLEDAMPAGQRHCFEAHVPACRGCAAYLAQMCQTIEALRSLREEEIPPHRREQLLGAFKDWQTL